MQSFCCPPTESGHVTLTALMCDNMHGVSPTRDAHLSFSVQSFYCALCACLWVSQTTHPNSITPSSHAVSPWSQRYILQARPALRETQGERLIHSLEVGSEQFGQEIQTFSDLGHGLKEGCKIWVNMISWVYDVYHGEGHGKKKKREREREKNAYSWNRSCY